MLGTILIVILILMLIGALPGLGGGRIFGAGAGYYPSGGIGLILLIIIILVLLGRV